MRQPSALVSPTPPGQPKCITYPLPLLRNEERLIQALQANVVVERNSDLEQASNPARQMKRVTSLRAGGMVNDLLQDGEYL